MCQGVHVSRCLSLYNHRILNTQRQLKEQYCLQNCYLNQLQNIYIFNKSIIKGTREHAIFLEGNKGTEGKFLRDHGNKYPPWETLNISHVFLFS